MIRHSLAYVVERKYANALLAGPVAVSVDAAVLVLRLALADLDEVWTDEHGCLQRRMGLAQEELASQVAELQRRQATIEALRAGLQQVMIENDAWEAECLKLRGMNESLSATSAGMGLPEPDVSSTSRPMDRMRPSPAVSSSENGAAAGRASSAGTSKRRKEKVKSENGELGAQEVGESTSLDPTPSPHLNGARTLLDNHHDLDRQIGFLAEGKNQWRQYSRPMRLAILAYLWEEQWSKVSEFDRTRPAWMPTGGALVFLSTDNRWSQIQQSVSELRALRSAMS